MSYVSSREAREHFQVSDQTLRRWAKENRISFKITQGGHYRFLLPTDQKRKIVYCRVSSSKQKSDLKNQVKNMRKLYPEYEIIEDVGSGINHKRKGFRSILQQLFQENISEVVVASPDRFTRFNYKFFEWLFEQFGARLNCVSRQKDISPEQELGEDLLSIITVFSARFHGKRKYTF
jgi:putative resolvase